MKSLLKNITHASFCFLTFWLSNNAFAQNSRIDSLKNILSKATTESAKAEVCHSLASLLWDYDTEAAKKFVDEAYSISNKLDDTKGIAEATTDLGIYAFLHYDYPRSKQLFRQAIAISSGKNIQGYPSFAYIHLGKLYQALSNYDSAKLCYQHALNLAETKNDLKIISSAYYHIGMLHLAEYNQAEAEKATLKSLSVRKQIGDSLLMAESWKGLVRVYIDKGEYAKAWFYLHQSHGVATRYKNPEALMFCHIYTGQLHFLEGNYDGALSNLEMALNALNKLTMPKYYALTLQWLAEVNWEIGDYANSLNYLLKALTIYEQLGAKRDKAHVLGQIGWVYISQRNDSLAMEMGTQALALATSAKAIGEMGYAKNLLGYLAFLKKQHSKSLELYGDALALRKQTNIALDIVGTQENIAWVYQELGQFKEAIDYHQNALELDQLIGNDNELAKDYNGLGRLYTQMKDYRKATDYLNQAQQFFQRKKAIPQLADNLLFRAQLAHAQNNNSEAVRLYQQLLAFNDSIASSLSKHKVLELNALYNLEKRESEILSLNEQNENRRNQMKTQESALSAQRTSLTLATVLISGLIIGAALLVRANLTRKKLANQLGKANNNLMQLNDTLKTRQEEITAQNEELTVAQEEILAQNDTLAQQNIELKKVRDTIANQNADLEVEVRSRTKELLEYNQQLEQFAFISSHNLRAPVARIMGLGNLLELDRNSNEEEIIIKKGLITSAKELDRVVRDLNLILEIKKNTTTTLAQIDLIEELSLVLINLEKEIQDTGTQIKIDFSQATSLKAIRPYLDSILINLIGNSIKYRHPERKAEISLSTQRKIDSIVLQVTDNGLGIDLLKYGEKVFRLYNRFHSHVEGKGLGLYLVKTQVEAMNGTIQIESQPNIGTTFLIELPLEQ